MCGWCDVLLWIIKYIVSLITGGIKRVTSTWSSTLLRARASEVPGLREQKKTITSGLDDSANIFLQKKPPTNSLILTKSLDLSMYVIKKVR